MNILRYPDKASWGSLTVRPHLNTEQLNDTVARILADVHHNGDNAVKRYEQQFDHAQLTDLEMAEEEKEAALRQVSPDLMQALLLAHNNIAAFHSAQRFSELKVETAPGVVCWQKSVPIERVGLYIPGGTAPLFSTVLMLATPAVIAGCKEIVLCTPPNREGHVNPAIVAAAQVAGVHRIFKAGGVQAIGALAYGTESVPKVYKIFGPGNQYVMAAKQQVSLHDVAIDMPAGPSEVCVVADESCRAEFVAADLISQAEHGIDSQVMLITTSEQRLEEIQQQLSIQLDTLPRRETASKALESSHLVLVSSLDEAMELSNAYAPEHLILATAQSDLLAAKVVNAGSVFLGNYSCESAGDYASGTNHTLPTHGYARAYNGVNLDSFCRKITFQHISAEGVRSIGPSVEVMARAEHLDAHARAMAVRLKSLEE